MADQGARSDDVQSLVVETSIPRPLPLPVEPGRARSRWWIVGLVTAVLLTIGLCAGSIAGIVYFVSSGLQTGSIDGSPTGLLDDTGVMRMEWTGEGRFAVIEYVAPGPPRTVTVVAWDSETGAVRRAEGCRLVAVEPSSTQVWLSKVPAVTLSPDARSDYSWSGPPRRGDMQTDMPGTPWVWDAAGGPPPSRPTAAAWVPWTGPGGMTASLTVDPSIGLWPVALSFGATGSPPVVAALTPETTFLPIGWSPSGRYFAIQVDDDEGVRIDVLDCATGKVVASDTDTSNSTSDAEPLTVWGGIAGAAWVGPGDTLTVLHYDTRDDGSTYRAWVATVEPGGQPKAVRDPPEGWTQSSNQPLALGVDEHGFLVGVETDGSERMYRVSGANIASVGTLDETDLLLEDSGAYSPRGLLLVRRSSEGFTESAADERAAVCRLDGSGVRVIWPKK